MENLIAAGGLAFAMVTWLLTLSYVLGRMAEKLDSMGKRLDRGDHRFEQLMNSSHAFDKAGDAAAVQIAALKADVDGLKRQLSKISDQNRAIWRKLQAEAPTAPAARHADPFGVQ